MGRIMKVSICIENKDVRNIIYHYMKDNFDVIVDLYNDPNDISVCGRNYDLIICGQEDYADMNMVNFNINNLYSRIILLSKQQLASQDWKTILCKMIKKYEGKWIELDGREGTRRVNIEDIVFIEMILMCTLNIV